MKSAQDFKTWIVDPNVGHSLTLDSLHIVYAYQFCSQLLHTCAEFKKKTHTK